MIRISILLCIVFLNFRCSDSDEDTATVSLGESLYSSPHSDGNSFSCKSCHGLSEPASDGIRRPGHQIGDASNRTSFKNGQLSSLLDAVNSCRTEWMAATAYTSEDGNWLALELYLKSQTTEATTANLTYEIVSPASDLSGGNAATGQTTFNTTCVVCHGVDAVGTDQGPALAGTTLSGEAIASRIRTSGSSTSSVYDGLTGGRMPFWSKDRITDQEINDIIAYLAQTEAASSTTTSSSAADISIASAQSNCTSNHSKVGKTGSLSEKQHDVSGKVTIVDDCTIKFENFNYDGLGIDVRMYSGSALNFTSGQAISKNIFGTAYSNSKVLLRLPTGVSLDDFDSISVWCVEVGVSFGDIQFQ